MFETKRRATFGLQAGMNHTSPSLGNFCGFCKHEKHGMMSDVKAS
jgi:hypothetical protein